jgi:pyruvate formate lyase activating enzyme
MQSSVSIKHAPVNKELSPVYALLRKPSLIDFPGQLCRVLFISGCNLRCTFCHNKDLLKPKDTSLKWERLLETLASSREYWVDAVCITGGEPTLHPQLSELIQRIKSLGFRVKLDTNGTRPDVLAEVLPLLDYLAMDYKAPLERYPIITGCPEFVLERITESVKLIMNSGCEYEFRTTVVESFHGEEDILAICRELAGASRYVLQAYVPPKNTEQTGELPDKRTRMSTLKKYHELCRGHFKEALMRGA